MVVVQRAVRQVRLMVAEVRQAHQQAVQRAHPTVEVPMGMRMAMLTVTPMAIQTVRVAPMEVVLLRVLHRIARLVQQTVALLTEMQMVTLTATQMVIQIEQAIIPPNLTKKQIHSVPQQKIDKLKYRYNIHLILLIKHL